MMSGISTVIDPKISGGEGPLRLWGLSTEDLHSAWWRSKGIQCVHRGEEFSPVEGAELFLLLDPDQCVVFELEEIVESIVWGMSGGLRLKIKGMSSETFREELRRGADGQVLGVRRVYGQDLISGHDVFLVTSPSVAEAWSRSAERREGVRLIRGLARKAFLKTSVVGHSYDCSKSDEQERFITWLVASWSRPEAVIEGIREVKSGVFMLENSTQPIGDRIIPPAWIGNTVRSEHQVLAGPDFRKDLNVMEDPVRVRDISEIQPPKGFRKSRLLPRRTVYGITKRSFDFLLAALGMIALAPVYVAVAILVVLDDGFPIFFGHQRQLRGGRDFKCWKFRTMRRDAESLVASLKSLNQADGPQVFIEHDPRVTRIGKYLRKLQLDELPQLWNVVRSEMSLVGPRPSPNRENQFCPAWRELRLSVRPGITGLWQVRRTRSEGEDFQEWIRFDVEYVRSASFKLDFQILIETFRQIVLKK